jgi:arsenate reductase-like glutaredoxin family protein
MNIQIFGTLKCRDTKKAQRYFRERRIPFQFVDLTRQGLNKGELNSLKASVGIDNLIDREGKTYAGKNLKYLIHDVEKDSHRKEWPRRNHGASTRLVEGTEIVLLRPCRLG